MGLGVRGRGAVALGAPVVLREAALNVMGLSLAETKGGRGSSSSSPLPMREPAGGVGFLMREASGRAVLSNELESGAES